MTTDNDEVVLEVEGTLATLRLNRPKAFNSLSMSVLEQMFDHLKDIAGRKDIRVVALRGEGKAFCAGHDLKEIAANRNSDYLTKLFAQCSDVMLSCLRLPQPVIAVVDGMATAAGCQLVATCDLAICTEESRFATSGVNYGLFCSTPMVALSRNIHRKAALEMLLTGQFISADDAMRHGLVNRVVEQAELDSVLTGYVDELSSKPYDTLALGKRAYYRQMEMGIADAYRFTSDVIRNNALDDNVAEGLSAFMEKRPPIWSD